jgi:hypothetical protein
MQNDVPEQDTAPPGDPAMACHRAPFHVAALVPAAMQNRGLTHDTELRPMSGVAITRHAFPFHICAIGRPVPDGSLFEPTAMQNDGPAHDTADGPAAATGVVPNPTSGRTRPPPAA